MKAQLKMQATRTDAQKSEIDEQTKRQSDTAQLIERVRHRLARSLARLPRSSRCRRLIPRPPSIVFLDPLQAQNHASQVHHAREA